MYAVTRRPPQQEVKSDVPWWEKATGMGGSALLGGALGVGLAGPLGAPLGAAVGSAAGLAANKISGDLAAATQPTETVPGQVDPAALARARAEAAASRQRYQREWRL